ncbi:UNVERIFIED_CONTAM: hypothetical protein FKN15_020500 [Acipenser sinensis]
MSVLLIFAIFAFATCGGYSGKSVISVFCRDGPNATLNVNFSYPFKLNQVVLVPSRMEVCNRTLQETHLVGDSSSSAEFFVSVAVFAFLYCIAALVLYVGYLHVYNESNRGPMIDFVVTCLFAFFWLVSSSAWAQGLRNVKTSIGTEGIRETLSACKEDGITCDVTSFANMGGLSVSVIHSEATRPIVPEDNTDLNGSTADPQAPYQPQGVLVHGEPWISLPT